VPAERRKVGGKEWVIPMGEETRDEKKAEGREKKGRCIGKRKALATARQWAGGVVYQAAWKHSKGRE